MAAARTACFVIWPLNKGMCVCVYLCNCVSFHQDESMPYSFFVDELEISDTLGKTLTETKMRQSSEAVVQIVYQAQAVFRVRAVTRCTGTIEGHAEAVLTLQFSPDGRYDSKIIGLSIH